MTNYKCFINEWCNDQRISKDPVIARMDPMVNAVLSRINVKLATPKPVSTIDEVLTHLRSMHYFDPGKLTAYSRPDQDYTLIIDEHNQIIGAVSRDFPHSFPETPKNVQFSNSDLKNRHIPFKI